MSRRRRVASPVQHQRTRLTRSVTVLLLVTISACDSSRRIGTLRQGTPSYKFDITTPSTPPAVGDDVSYVIFARDRRTSQPIETGDGRIFARAGGGVVSELVKAPQVGQYVATMKFSRGGDWMLGLRFRDRPTKPLELTQWVQHVRSASDTGRKLWLVQPRFPWGSRRQH